MVLVVLVVAVDVAVAQAIHRQSHLSLLGALRWHTDFWLCHIFLITSLDRQSALDSTSFLPHPSEKRGYVLQAWGP